MKKKKIKVPAGIRYLGQWADFGKELPDSHIILNKAHTGVGATQYFLTNPSKTIVCTPRISLIESKREKHPDVWYYRDMADTTTSDNEKKNKPKKKASYQDIQQYNSDVVKYVAVCMNQGKVPKIMVTYDSLGHVYDALKSISPNEPTNWTLVIDEFQVIFGDSIFKSLTEMSFLANVSHFKKVVYLSATPYLEKYLDELDTFKNLPFYELEWPEDMKEQAVVTNILLKGKTRNKQCQEIIKKMKAGKTVKFGNKEIDTTEAVFYINNVADILKICKTQKLKPDEVNILCSKTNEDRLVKAGYKMGNFPKEGDPHKPFTFCTRSSFLGVDFYSTCAYSYVFADPSQKTLALDISTDLMQILGRQRLDSNPYKNEAILFIKENSIGLDDEEFKQYIDKKVKQTEMLMNNYNKMDSEMQKAHLKIYRNMASTQHFSDNYLCVVNDQTDKPSVAFNYLYMYAEIRAWDIQKTNYNSQYSVIRQQQEQGIDAVVGTNSVDPDVLAFKSQFDNAHQTDQRIRLYCEFRKLHPDLIGEVDFVSPKYESYWDALGYENLAKLGFQESKIKQAQQEPMPWDDTLEKVILEVRKNLKERKYKAIELKKELQKAYDKAGCSKKAKATDIDKYVSVKPYQDSKTGKRFTEVTSLFKEDFTLFPFVWRPNVPMKMSISRLLGIIKTGKYKVSKSKAESRELKDIIEEIRSLSDHDMQNEVKRDWLPVACINGTFSHKDDRSIISYSSFVAIDYDGFKSKEDMEKAKNTLMSNPYTYALWETPSGYGLKTLIRHDSVNPELHWNLYQQVLGICKLPELDKSVNDLSRGQFLSYDPGIWVNPSSKTFEFKLDPSIQPPEKKTEKYITPKDNGEPQKLDDWTSDFLIKLGRMIQTDEAILRQLDKHWKNDPENYKEHNRHPSIYRMAGTLCKAGIKEKTAYEYLVESYPDMPEDEISSIVEYAYEHNAFGSDRRFYK